MPPPSRAADRFDLAETLARISRAAFLNPSSRVATALGMTPNREHHRLDC
jgi:hypothetical protein